MPISPAMLRQLLTLLAVITGLAATGEVAQARVASVENVRLELVREAQAPAVSPAAAIMAVEPVRIPLADPLALACVLLPGSDAPATRIGIDRARE